MNSIRFKKFGMAALLSLACVAGLAACSASAGSASSGETSTEGLTGGVAATVNGVEIMEDDVTEFVQSYRTSGNLTDEESWGTHLASSNMTPESFREQVIDYLVSQELVKQAAEERNISVTDEEVDEQVSIMRANFSDDEAWQTALTQAGTTEEEYRSSVRESMVTEKLQKEIAAEAKPITDEEMLESVKMYTDYFNGARRSSQILFNAEDEQTAKDVLAQINDGTLKFEDAVTEYSQDGSASNGGDVGWNVLNNFVTEYADALAELDKDEVSGLVESQFGYHIIKCTDVFETPEGGITSLDQVPTEMVDYIRSMLESSNETNAVYEWFDSYKEAADIQVNEMPEGLPYYVDITKYETASSDAATVDATTVTEEASSAESSDAATGEAASASTETATTSQPAEISSEAEARSSEAA